MLNIPCTIKTGIWRGETIWEIQVPAHAVENAAKRFSELLSGTRNRVVFLHGKTEFAVTADTAAYNGRQVPITRDFLECLENLFSQVVRPGRSHLDYDFSDRHGDVTITVSVV